MKEVPTTLAGFKNLLQLKPQSMAHMPCEGIAKGYTTYLQSSPGKPRAEFEAANFYGMNHLAAIVSANFDPLETLPEWAREVMVVHNDNLQQACKRMFFYMLMICVRESRHLHNAAAYKSMIEGYGGEAWVFHKKISGTGSDTAVEHFRASPPIMPVGPFVDSIVDIFNKGSFGSSFGGKKWGKIAECLQSFINGKTSLEMMVDTAFTLSHNTGPIFNKGMVMGMFDASYLMKVLDVQRSGQIPEGILDGTIQLFDVKVHQMTKLVKQNLPESFGSYVDWFKVEQLGSVKKYAAEKKAQEQKYGKKPSVSSSGKPVIGHLEVWPGQVVSIVKRKAA